MNVTTHVTTRLLLNIGIAAAIAIVAAPSAQAQSVTVAEQKAAGAQQGVLGSAKNLYASASYEAALLELVSPGPKDDADEVDVYRALCFLALDRPRDAEQTLENIATRTPQYTVTEAEYSPRLVALFRTVRKRALPVAAQRLYSAAKVEYESGNYALAEAKFKQLFSVLNDPDVSGQAGTLTDLRELADGFAKLSAQKLADAAAATAVRTPSVPAPPVVETPSIPAAVEDPALVHTAVDAGIRPPSIISQTMPPWIPPNQSPFLRARTYSGRLELIIDEHGAVARAILVESIWPAYDSALLQAAKHWRYEPAQMDGKPVKFFKFLDITLNKGDTQPHP
jgi:tetratricopeptide (TPR) repeat protein